MRRKNCPNLEKCRWSLGNLCTRKWKALLGRKKNLGRTTNVVDSVRLTPPVARHFGRCPPTPCALYVGMDSPATSAAIALESPTEGTPGDDTPSSTCRMWKAVGTDNLVDFVKDFNYEYFTHMEAQDKDKHVWRS